MRLNNLYIVGENWSGGGMTRSEASGALINGRKEKENYLGLEIILLKSVGI